MCGTCCAAIVCMSHNEHVAVIGHKSSNLMRNQSNRVRFVWQMTITWRVRRSGIQQGRVQHGDQKLNRQGRCKHRHFDQLNKKKRNLSFQTFLRTSWASDCALLIERSISQRIRRGDNITAKVATKLTISS